MSAEDVHERVGQVDFMKDTYENAEQLMIDEVFMQTLASDGLPKMEELFRGWIDWLP